jgi:hypothetical protein
MLANKDKISVRDMQELPDHGTVAGGSEAAVWLVQEAERGTGDIRRFALRVSSKQHLSVRAFSLETMESTVTVL